MIVKTINLGICYYSITDILWFEEYINYDNFEKYLRIVSTYNDEEVLPHIIIKIKNIPDYILILYKYILDNTTIIYDENTKLYNIYGIHLKKSNQSKYNLVTTSINPIGKISKLLENEIIEQSEESKIFYKKIYSRII
jgi:hypothetical protein